MEKTYTINAAPSLTWNWLKSNCDTVSINSKIENAVVKYDSLPDGIEISDKLPEITFSESGVLNIPNKKFGDKPNHAQNSRITTAAKQSNEEIKSLFNQIVSLPQNFIISEKVEKPLILKLSQEKNSASIQNIILKENSEATVVLLYEGDVETQLVTTNIYAGACSKLNLIKVQLLGSNAAQLDDTVIICDDKASVNFTQIELGGNHIDSGLHTSLKGYESTFKSNVAYLCENNQFLDMNHIVYHYGKKTECDMQVKGTLKDQAIKAYRGTIDFKNGCCGSKGNEMEETLLLSPVAVNKSLPVILCDEEDVEGEHGATIGRLSSDILFYMESRGISETEAEEIMSIAKIQAAADLIPDESIKEKISNFINKQEN